MKLSLKREWLEYGMLFIVLGILLWIGPGRIWDHRIDQGYPYAYNAADAFQHQSRAAGIAIIGDYKYEPVHHFAGAPPEFPGYYPPLFPQLGALLIVTSGLKSFISVPGLLFFSTIISAALMYLLIRRFNPTVALLALPLFPFVFLNQAISNAYTWGHWPQMTGQVFLIFVAWILSQLPFEKWEILLLCGLSGTVLMYTGHAVMAALFMMVFIITYVLKNGLRFDFLARLALIALGVIIISFQYLIYFLNIWAPLQLRLTSLITEWRSGGGVFTLGGFLTLKWMVLTGVVVGALLLIQQARKKDSGKWVPILFSLTMLALGYANYIGFGKRAFFIRSFWPFYLSLFLGLAIYTLGKILLPRVNLKWKTSFAIVVSTTLLLIVLLVMPSIATGSGLMNPPLWDGLMWLQQATPEDARILFWYGDGFVGDNTWNIWRYHQYVQTEDYIAALQNLSVRRHYYTSIVSDSFPYFVIPIDLHKKNPLFWGWTWNNTYDFRMRAYRDICEMDYFVFAKGSRQPVLAQYGLYIASKLLEKDWITEAFQNEYILILRNGQPGDTCIEDHKIQQ